MAMNSELKLCPCKDYIVRGRFAIGLDMHFWGDDCPYKCDAYDNWRTKHDTRRF